MKPKLFRLSDLSLVSIPLVVILLTLAAIIATLFSNETIAIPGYVIAAASIAICLFLVIGYYAQRWKFISMYRYTTDHGISFYFEDGTKNYTRVGIEYETDKLFNIWKDNCDLNSAKLEGAVSGSFCIFKKEKVFNFSFNFVTRKVYGVASWNWMIVGQGNDPIEKTAYRHELSHIILNNTSEDRVTESEAHEFFKTIGV